MRFKPRTDLERVYDIINSYKYGQERREILDKQLKNLDMLKYKNSHELNDLIKEKIKSQMSDKYLDNMNNSYDKIKSMEFDKNNKLYYNPRNINYKLKPWIKREDLNADAYKLLTSYHYKTHFKAAKEVAGNKSNINEKENNIDNTFVNIKKKEKSIKNLKYINKKDDKKSCLLLPNLFKKKNMIKSSTQENNLLENISLKTKNIKDNLIDIKIDDDKNDIFIFYF